MPSLACVTTKLRDRRLDLVGVFTSRPTARSGTGRVDAADGDLGRVGAVGVLALHLVLREAGAGRAVVAHRRRELALLAEPGDVRVAEERDDVVAAGDARRTSLLVVAVVVDDLLDGAGDQVHGVGAARGGPATWSQRAAPAADSRTSTTTPPVGWRQVAERVQYSRYASSWPGCRRVRPSRLVSVTMTVAGRGARSAAARRAGQRRSARRSPRAAPRIVVTGQVERRRSASNTWSVWPWTRT